VLSGIYRAQWRGADAANAAVVLSEGRESATLAIPQHESCGPIPWCARHGARRHTADVEDWGQERVQRYEAEVIAHGTTNTYARRGSGFILRAQQDSRSESRGRCRVPGTRIWAQEGGYSSFSRGRTAPPAEPHAQPRTTRIFRKHASLDLLEFFFREFFSEFNSGI
jgi:hypothetical protein